MERGSWFPKKERKRGTRPRCRKTTGTPPFEPQKFTAKNPSPSPSISPEFGHTSSWVLLLTSPVGVGIFRFGSGSEPKPIGRIVDDRPLGKLAALGARSAAIAARGRSPPAPLDSPRSELSDLSFSSSLTEVRSPLTDRGNSEDPRTRINPRTLLTPSLDIVTEICRYISRPNNDS
ncbi:hypothetical protein CUMW_222270 [Citrus unshiu]|nr:hypothetical protein CUMW_222270 [Citrus unshiu]